MLRIRLLMAFAGCLLLVVLAPAGAGASFGIESFGGSIVNRDGSTDTQAGSHPYAYSTNMGLQSFQEGGNRRSADGNVKDVEVDLPAGFVGDPGAIPECTDEQLQKRVKVGGRVPRRARSGR